MESQVSSLSLVEVGIQSALNLAGVGVWEQNIDEGQVICSDGFYQLMGVEPDAGRAQDGFWRSRVHPEDQARHDVAYSDFLQGLVPTYEEIYRLRHEKGAYITVLARARWESQADGQAGRRILGYAIDVTARSADFDRLRVREERFRMSLSALHGVVYDLDLRTNRSERHGLKRMLGYETLGSRRRVCRLAVHRPSGRSGAGGRERATPAAALPPISRCPIACATWTVAGAMCASVAPTCWGTMAQPIRAYGVIEDVTDAEAQREQLQMQAAIIERMSEGVMLVVARRHHPVRQPRTREDVRLRARRAAGPALPTMLSFRSKANFDGLLRAVFEGTEDDRTSIIDLEGRRRDGSMCPLQGYFSSMMLGEPRCVVAVFTDISERKQLERELLQVATRVQQRIGSDLHDGVGQQLAGIAMMLQGLGQRAGNVRGPDAARRSGGDRRAGQRRDPQHPFAGARPVAGASRSRGTARRLRGAGEPGAGAVPHPRAAWNWSCRRTCGSTRTPPPTCIASRRRACSMPRAMPMRHQIDLRLRVAGPDVELLVIDDGRGFDPLQFARGGMGLRIMRFRAQMIGGYLVGGVPARRRDTLRCRCPVQMQQGGRMKPMA